MRKNKKIMICITFVEEYKVFAVVTAIVYFKVTGGVN